MVNTVEKFRLEEDGRRQQSRWWILAVVTLGIGLIALIVVVVLYCVSGRPTQEFGIVIDAGSSHSGIFVYSWNGRTRATGVVRQHLPLCYIADSLSSFENNPQQAGESLLPCLRNVTSLLPANAPSRTATYLAATAGMRLLEVRRPLISCMIMNSVHNSLRSSGFAVKNISVITGAEEGLFGWITINYLSGRLLDRDHPQRPGTTGALDMGGASTQIAYEVNHTVAHPEVRTVKLFGEVYHMFVRSYLCCGMNEVIRMYRAALVSANLETAVVQDPCLPRNLNLTIPADSVFLEPCAPRPAKVDTVQTSATTIMQSPLSEYVLTGTSDPDGCQAKVHDLLASEGSRCSMKADQMPRPAGAFFAFSGFYYVASTLNCTVNCSLEQLHGAVQSFCKLSKDELPNIPNPSFAYSMCLRAMYTLILFRDVYKFDASVFRQVQFVKQIGSSDIGWTLGMMLHATNQLPEERPEELIGVIEFSVVSTAACMITVLGMIILVYVLWSKYC